MEDTLKAFIRKNRDKMDIHEPADLWSAISLQLAAPQPVLPKKLTWLKKGLFGLSATTAVVTSAYLLTKNETPAVVAAKTETHSYIPAEPPVEAAVVTLAVLPADTVKKDKPKEPLVNILPFPEAPAVPPVPPVPVTEAVPAPEAPAPVEAIPASAVNYETTDSSSSKRDTIFKGITKIEISGEFFDVDVKVHSQPDVLFYEEHSVSVKGAHSKISKYNVVTEKKDSTLKIYIDAEDHRGIMIVGSISISGMMALTVPEGTEVIVHNVSGNVKLNGLKGKKAEVHTSSGDIGIDNISGPLNMQSVSGDIRIKSCKGNVVMTSSSGDQYVENLEGNFTTQSVSGNLHFTNVKGNANLASSSGDQVLSGIEGNIHASAVSGNITVNDCKGDLTLNTSSGNLTGKNNRLSTGSKLQSVSGDIKMSFANDKKELSYDLNSVSGGLSVENGSETVKEEKRLMLRQGAIMVQATTSSGDQRFK